MLIEWKKWIKKLRWLPGILIVLFLVVYLEGNMLWLGIWGFILFCIVLAAWRMYQGREQIKMLFDMAGNLGAMHKARAEGGKNDKGIKRRNKSNN